MTYYLVVEALEYQFSETFVTNIFILFRFTCLQNGTNRDAVLSRLHGIAAIVDALVRGLEKFGGRISLQSHVENIVVENDRAIGVKLRSGQVSIF